MRSLERFVQQDPMTRSSEPVAQLNIFDRGVWKTPLVKAAHLLKHRATDSAATGPERRCLRLTVLVHEVMEQVAILGDHTLGPGSGIVGAEDSREVWMLLEHLCHTANRFGGDDDVGVNEEENVAPRVTRTAIAGGGGPRVRSEPEHAYSHPPGDRSNVIRRRI